MKTVDWEIIYFVKDPYGSFVVHTEKLSNPVVPRIGERISVIHDENFITFKVVDIHYEIQDWRIEVVGEKI